MGSIDPVIPSQHRFLAPFEIRPVQGRSDKASWLQRISPAEEDDRDSERVNPTCHTETHPLHLTLSSPRVTGCAKLVSLTSTQSHLVLLPHLGQIHWCALGFKVKNNRINNYHSQNVFNPQSVSHMSNVWFVKRKQNNTIGISNTHTSWLKKWRSDLRFLQGKIQ